MPSDDILFHVTCGRSGILRSMIGRYDLIKAAGFLDERFPVHDGFILSVRLAKLTRYIPEPLVEKREHVGGVSKALSNRQNARYLEDVFSEVATITSHLLRWQQRRIKKVWSRMLLNPRVMAEVEAGRKWKALLDIARAFARDPGNSRNVRRVIKDIFNWSPA
ncbi:MAG TPA: hypothetical protein VN952_09755 [Chthoniobacterales bacterium]|nr:hypothetical protein [Chthoniobacterales bacterium]